MKKIEAIVRPEVFQELREKLVHIGIGGLTVFEAAGCGNQKGKRGAFRGTSYELPLVSRIKVEMVTEEHRVDEIVGAILEACGTGQVGDGKIFISPIEEVIRIRSGERGKQAVL
ncbi:P-II family nitrogen regulator [Jeotgalibacillus sp. R-1-5s-1]|uniref:P-II family nitrogen regulator n=1 Tax=Jeotgalibacillus sp. R-1-5s-1 TaxID=2555897 RepID=UPI00106B3E56|nr:P-II family nitrogen regulator [Jeotgalibacillus sp. R-1-5s-1]TFD97623.1 P-II family nitrogen regulator [Jeotgalibacillus sp. R-1-5s-1]